MWCLMRPREVNYLLREKLMKGSYQKSLLILTCATFPHGPWISCLITRDILLWDLKIGNISFMYWFSYTNLLSAQYLFFVRELIMWHELDLSWLVLCLILAKTSVRLWSTCSSSSFNLASCTRELPAGWRRSSSERASRSCSSQYASSWAWTAAARRTWCSHRSDSRYSSSFFTVCCS